MKVFLVAILTASFFFNVTNIFVENNLKENALFAFKSKDYKTALKFYTQLVEQQKNTEPSVLYNYANVLLVNKDTIKARGLYGQVIKSSKNNLIRSRAYNQAAFIEFEFNKNIAEAIELLKKALIENDANQMARKNLYCILNLHAETSENEKQSKANSHNASNENSNGIGNSENDETVLENNQSNSGINAEDKELSQKLEELNMTPERAKQILDAMQKQELQYIQQINNHKTTEQDKDLPNW